MIEHRLRFFFFQVVKKEHPNLKIERMSAICPNESLNNINCSSFVWSAVTVFSSAEVNITDYTLSENLYMNITEVDEWTKEVYVRYDFIV